MGGKSSPSEASELAQWVVRRHVEEKVEQETMAGGFLYDRDVTAVLSRLMLYLLYVHFF